MSIKYHIPNYQQIMQFKKRNALYVSKENKLKQKERYLVPTTEIVKKVLFDQLFNTLPLLP